MAHGTFVTAINCMDGRVQDAVKNYMQKKYGVDFVDAITEPGPNKILADAKSNPSASSGQVIENIKKRVAISVEKHGSKVIAIVGHHDCAGNPVAKEEQIKHLKEAKKVVEGFGFPVEVILLFVEGDWATIEEI